MTFLRPLLIQFALVLISLVGFAGAAAAAPQPKVEICHIPPGNPSNFHTITVSTNALEAHLAHGDLGGACDSVCATICDDGNACTIDDTGDCETAGCPGDVRDPVDCDDGSLCTTDSCDPANGCSNDPVVCDDPDLCTVSQCAPDTGQCVDSPIVCPDGFSCSLDTGLCEEDAGPDPECAGQTCSTFTTCNNGGSCGFNGVCGSTAEGGGLCVDGSTACAGLTQCNGGTGDCAVGDICFVDSCCGVPVCMPSSQFCSDPLSAGGALTSSSSEASETSSGPTFGSE